MNAFLLIVPLFLIRFLLLGMIGKGALGRASFFAPVEGEEKIAYWFYQISNIFIIAYPLALKIRTTTLFFAIFVYIVGAVLLVISTVSFAFPKQNGINTNGIYKFSRNPMYVGYFIYFLGCVLFTHSLPLLFALLIFQVSAHWIILSEERWCVKQFGSEYISYMNRVRRYI